MTNKPTLLSPQQVQDIQRRRTIVGQAATRITNYDENQILSGFSNTRLPDELSNEYVTVDEMATDIDALLADREAREEYKELRAVLTLYEAKTMDEYDVFNHLEELYINERLDKAVAGVYEAWADTSPDSGLIYDLKTAIGYQTPQEGGVGE